MQPLEWRYRLRDYRAPAPDSQLFVRIFRRSLPDLFFRIGRRWNYVSAARPFSEVDGAAVLAAKGKLGIAALDNFLAYRAAKLQCALGRHDQGSFRFLPSQTREFEANILLQNLCHQIIVVSLGDRATVKLASSRLRLFRKIVYENLAVDFWSMHRGSTLHQQVGLLR